VFHHLRGDAVRAFLQPVVTGKMQPTNWGLIILGPDNIGTRDCHSDPAFRLVCTRAEKKTQYLMCASPALRNVSTLCGSNVDANWRLTLRIRRDLCCSKAILE